MSSKLLTKINLLNRKLNKVEKIEGHLDKLVTREEEDIKKVEEEEARIERTLIKIGNFEVKRAHILELVRGTAGAFLGVGLGQAILGSVDLAGRLPWLNTLGILAFVLILVGILIYRKDKAEIEKRDRNAYGHVMRKLVTLYIISLVVQLLGLILFDSFPGWNETLAKALIIGSYAAMSSAVAFTLI